MSGGPRHSVSVAGVTVDQANRVLLIKRRDNGQWQAPGGVLELNETFEQCVVREVFEETGVWVSPTRLTGVYKNLVQGVVALVYRCDRVGGEPDASDESVDVEWVPLPDALVRMTPAFAVRVRDATSVQVDAVPTRTHDGENLIISSADGG